MRQECVLLDLVNHLYFTVFKLFNEYWLEQKHDIMKFNQFLNFGIYDQIFLPKVSDIIQEYVHEKKSKKD